MSEVKSLDWEQQTEAAPETQPVLFSRAVHCRLLKRKTRKVLILALNDQISGATTKPSLPSAAVENNLKFSLPFHNGNVAASYEFETIGNFTAGFSYLLLSQLPTQLHTLLWLQVEKLLEGTSLDLS